MSSPPLDPISIGILAATFIVGAGAAQYIGPYLVISLGALLGALLALRRREPGPRMPALLFVAALMFVSVSVTIPFAESAAAFIGKDWKWIACPMATGLAALGEDWIAVGNKIKALYFSLLDKMRPDTKT